MTTSNRTRAGIVAGIAAGTLALLAATGAVAASAADSSTPGAASPSSSSAAAKPADATRVQEQALTGTTADQVKAAALAKYPGATVDKMETDGDEGATYEAYLTKADGTHVKVLLDSTFAVTGESAKGAGHGPHGGAGAGAARTPETELTGTTADKVKAAVEAKYAGATIERMETDSDEGASYEAHVTKADGTHVKVLLDSAFSITSEVTGGPGGHGPNSQGAGGAGKGGRGHHGMHQDAPTGSGSSSSGSSSAGASAAA